MTSTTGTFFWKSLMGIGLACALMGAGRAPKTDAGAADASKKGPFSGFTIYSDDRSPNNHYIPSGWMGDTANLKMETASTETPHSGKTCLKFTYKPAKPGPVQWTGVYWQDPANNWGDIAGGFDLTGAVRLTFWARGEKGGEILKEVKVGGIKGKYLDSTEATSGPITLTNKWEQYTIDLSGRDLSALSGGFAWATDLPNNPNGITFYLDDIKFE